jgi:hypothetical protein
MTLFCLLFSLTACSAESTPAQSNLASQATQFLTFNPETPPITVLAESGPCAQGLASSYSTFVQNYCFNEIPAIQLDVTAIGISRTAFCVATHLPGMAFEAAVLVVDMEGRYVSEATGSGALQMIDSLGVGRYLFYVGFPSSGPGQKAKIRVAATSQFSMASPACTLR